MSSASPTGSTAIGASVDEAVRRRSPPDCLPETFLLVGDTSTGGHMTSTRQTVDRRPDFPGPAIGDAKRLARSSRAATCLLWHQAACCCDSRRTK